MWGPARTYPPGEPKVPLVLARPDQPGTSCPGCVPLQLTYNPNTEPQAVELETKVHTKISNHREGSYQGLLLVASGYYHYHI